YTEEQWHGTYIHLMPFAQLNVVGKNIAIWVVLTPFLIEISTEEFRCIVGKPQKLNAYPMTSLAKGVRFLEHATCYPIAEREASNFRDPTAGFKQDTRYALLTEPPVQQSATCKNSTWKGGIINHLRNPLFSFELEVAVCEPPLVISLFHTA